MSEAIKGVIGAMLMIACGVGMPFDSAVPAMPEETYAEAQLPAEEEKDGESGDFGACAMEYAGEYEITAYEWTGNPCTNGEYPTEGYTVACNSLPLGTVLYIDGIGYRTVEDRGADWHGENWIDLYLGDEAACYEWGVQSREVWIVK